LERDIEVDPFDTVLKELYKGRSEEMETIVEQKRKEEV
jgi:hypothetical protein